MIYGGTSCFINIVIANWTTLCRGWTEYLLIPVSLSGIPNNNSGILIFILDGLWKIKDAIIK